MHTYHDTPQEPYSTESPGGTLDYRPRSWDDLGKIAASIVVGLYALGLIVTNSYLYVIGVTDFSPFRTRYVLTGLSAILPLLLCAYSITVGTALWYRQAHARTRRAMRDKANVISDNRKGLVTFFHHNDWYPKKPHGLSIFWFLVSLFCFVMNFLVFVIFTDMTTILS